MSVLIKISVQAQDFNVGDELELLEKNNDEDGAVVTFSGRVRNKNLNENVIALSLEHYPGMTESSLKDIAEQACQRWSIGRITIIHRIGKLEVGEQIVFVGVTSKHRGDAFAANEFIMDFLKVKAPFWKKELTDQGEKWLDSRVQDSQKAEQWDS